jgi:undecaprenyl-diphosphatase
MDFASLSRWERPACVRANRANRSPLAGTVFAVASRLGDGACWYLLMVLLPMVYGLGAQGLGLSLAMAACGLAGTGIYKLIKGSTRRPRPCADADGLVLTVPPLDVFSFPSGHTLHAVAFTTLVCWQHPVLLWVLAPFTGLVAASRVVLGLHYPSDVAAGAALGAVLALATIALAGWMG